MPIGGAELRRRLAALPPFLKKKRSEALMGNLHNLGASFIATSRSASLERRKPRLLHDYSPPSQTMAPPRALVWAVTAALLASFQFGTSVAIVGGALAFFVLSVD